MLNPDDEVEAAEKLGHVGMFRAVSVAHLYNLVRRMTVRRFEQNEVMVKQGDVAEDFLLVSSGSVVRLRTDEDGVERQLDEGSFRNTVNSLNIAGGDRSYSTAKCVSPECKAFVISREEFNHQITSTPSLAHEIIVSLSRESSYQTRQRRTPLLRQQTRELNIPAITIAATIESYYRSALNAFLNQRLTGHRAELFPNMHIQVPTRIIYINGFKIMRAYIDKYFDPEDYSSRGPLQPLVRFGAVIAPGVLMTPISSVLEATNAGHQNPEPMTKRWIRGLTPRGVREVIFGIGLNQMSDYLEERTLPVVNDNIVLANAAGSLLAGVISGYLSHIPHNLSAYKLLQPDKSYGELYRMFVEKSAPPGIQSPFARAVFATLFPRGVIIRTLQIVGSFVILNGTITLIQRQESRTQV
mmetsp:Transcript_4509/g.9000  ORF Transcript_4509/g.9000 Transcript_4509/m.9000 type:complete len:412 (-) Transcript_4509:1167-2402(-)|eukprot:CAMPEP_0184680708 /NCGR_PEP_ID=MMETSP0312-20130426/3614_1 /TAXON_ID=31354 /ORGANISM="Compsopogon coeruleus, Strain SAG 36.94" /LENGTH=411 /DNA_ID=CAMNT_0027131017 /DNA_START=857 /DNA_END=2092 /DNA_ORIENTATION=+